MKVRCEIEGVDEENENGKIVPAIQAHCGRCGHSTLSFGTSEASIKRCLVLLRESCPYGEANFYVNEGD